MQEVSDMNGQLLVLRAENEELDSKLSELRDELSKVRVELSDVIEENQWLQERKDNEEELSQSLVCHKKALPIHCSRPSSSFCDSLSSLTSHLRVLINFNLFLFP